MRIEDLNWMDVEKYLKGDDRLMFVIGSTEQHGHLSLLTDVKIPLALADSASQSTGVLVAPPLNYGASPYFLSYPGTLSLRASTLMAAVEDVVRSAFRGGFRRILVLNGHGGNSAAKAGLYELNNELPELRLNWYEW
jgi:creatinine amidohydrolase